MGQMYWGPVLGKAPTAPRVDTQCKSANPTNAPQQEHAAIVYVTQFAVVHSRVSPLIITSTNVLWIRNSRHALRQLAVSRWTLLHMQQ